MLKDFEIEQLLEPLLLWFPTHARELPWRLAPTPYRVWVSEIMLQQTRVEAVKPYFERFLTALPDVEALAKCPEDELLKLWEGLGYYNRVRNMQKAAITVMEEYDGQLPASYEELRKLKGIGNYTAGAVASIAFGIVVPAVDGNVLRILTRATADDTDIMNAAFRKEVEECLGKAMQNFYINETIKQTLPHENVPGALNQAMMELGATVCVPNGAPLCDCCPWQQVCRAKKEDKIALLPVKSKAKARKIEKRTVLIIRDEDKVAIRKRPKKGLLAGLYELPNVEGELDDNEVLSLVEKMNFEPIRIQKLADAKHIFSHIEWHMIGYTIQITGADFAQAENKKIGNEELLFVDAKDARERYAIPSAFAAYAEYMDIKLGKKKTE